MILKSFSTLDIYALFPKGMASWIYVLSSFERRYFLVTGSAPFDVITTLVNAVIAMSSCCFCAGALAAAFACSPARKTQHAR